MTADLTEHERAVLDVERRAWRYPGTKDLHIREALGISPVEHARRLNELLDTERALAFDPVLVNRLRRRRDQARGRRSA